MTWYPDCLVALDEVAKGKANASLTRRDAENVIRELTEWRTRAETAESALAEKIRAAQGAGLFGR